MRKFLMTALAALAIISCEKPGSELLEYNTHTFTAKGNSPSLFSKGGNTIEFSLNGESFTATDGDITLPSETQAIVNYTIPSAYGEYLEMIIDVQDGGPVGITFKFWHGSESFYSFYFDNIETDESTTAWIARASNGKVDEVTNDLGYTGMNVGDDLVGEVEIAISKESAATGGKSSKSNLVEIENGDILNFNVPFNSASFNIQCLSCGGEEGLNFTTSALETIIVSKNSSYVKLVFDEDAYGNNYEVLVKSSPGNAVEIVYVAEYSDGLLLAYFWWDDSAQKSFDNNTKTAGILGQASQHTFVNGFWNATDVYNNVNASVKFSVK